MKQNKLLFLSALTFCVICVFALSIPVGQHSLLRKKVSEKEAIASEKYRFKADTDSVFIPPSGFRPPALLVKKQEGDTASSPMKISSCSISIQVVGGISQTTLELSFYNDLNRQLEGEFCFPLGQGQRVSGFALETNGQMRAGVVVGKKEGRQIFESIVRRRIDPGLLEWTAGNTFRARVFPIPAKGNKRIRITFESELIAVKGGLVYFLPVNYHQLIDDFSLHAEVIRQTVKPEPYGKDITTLEFSSWNNSWVASKKMQHYQANAPLVFEIPETEKTPKVFTEKCTGDSSWFSFTVDPGRLRQTKKAPSRICILWDVSGSGRKRDLHKELNLLDTYFQFVQHASLRLVTFSNEINSDQEFNLDKGNWTAMHQVIDSLDYDGGTQLGALDLNKYACDEFILFSDGLSNFGAEELIPGSAPVIVISTSQTADYEKLQYVALQTNGQFINGLTCTPADAKQSMETLPYRFLSASFNNQVISQVYPSLPAEAGRSMTFSGIIKGNEGEITLHFGFGNETVTTQKITVSRSEGMEVGDQAKGIIAGLWAGKKISELESQPEKNKSEITILGKAYSVVSRYTSLLVLDRIEDYVQYRVMPPEGDLRKLYQTALKEEVQEKQKTEKDHMEMVVRDFKERVEWWKTDYKPVIRKEKAARFEGDASGYSIADSARGGTLTYSFSTGASSGAMNVTSTNETQANNLTPGTYAVQADDIHGEAEGKADKKSEEKINSVYNKPKSEINLKTWDPQTPYMTALKTAPKGAMLKTYRKLRQNYGDSPSFFMDASDFVAREGDPRAALRILTNLAELKAEDHQALRVLAHRLEQQGYLNLAILTFRKIQTIRSEEPQSYRDLGLALAANKEYPEAILWLSRVVNRKWDSRFPRIESLVACEINHILGVCGDKYKADSLDPRLIAAMPVDVRVVINWDSDNCDLDLWTTDPYKELCMY
ncbi:MAG TPA: VIT domain-containing protein, partial [Bacteroidia bacterium]|nr:VIT domain-containing protein [Bacteroidia bacterium]